MEDNLQQDSSFMDKYSRQIGAYGIETMAKLVKLKVLIVGMKGVGIECAKNLVLAGPGTVTIQDDGETEMKDLGSNFFLTKADVGSPRASACVSQLAELNKMVTVRAHVGELTAELMSQHSVVVMTNVPREEMIKWNAYCRSQTPAIAFIASDIRGAMGYVFTDFSDHFICHDATGETPISRIVTNITPCADGKSVCVSLLGPDEDGKMHEMPDSDHDGWLELSEVKGMTDTSDASVSINSLGPYRITFATKTVTREKKGVATQVEVFDPYRLICPLPASVLSSLSPYEGGGMVLQHKKPYALVSRSLAACLDTPVADEGMMMMFTDGAKFGRSEQLHLALYGVFEFEAVMGHLPRAHNADDAAKVLSYARRGPVPRDNTLTRQNDLLSRSVPFTTAPEDIDADVIRTTALYAEVELHPLAAFFGGVVAQEIVKFTGKFTPLSQWFHLDAFEVLPDVRPGDVAPINSRYDHMIAIYGKAYHEKKIQTVKTFLVGCGALGCEYLKNFAMIGLACGPEGQVTVTDNDRIEVSNLNRQFLFREHNVGQAKSLAASAAVGRMNPQLNIIAHEHLVCPATEHIFNDTFWSGMDVITNALDNVKARLYVDTKCVAYARPLLESGTLGTKCNVQVIIPHLTASYADGPKDAENDSIPMCTLRNFPSLIEHCIEWARAQFEDLFVVPSADALKFKENPAIFLQEIKTATIEHVNPSLGASAIGQELERLRVLHLTLTEGRDMTFDTCVVKAFTLFHTSFRDRICQLIHNFPESHVTNAGEPFWSGAKRFPSPAMFSLAHENAVTFLIAAANLYAVSYGLQPYPEEALLPLDSSFRTLDTLRRVLETTQTVPSVWQPSGEKIAANEAERKVMEAEAAKDTTMTGLQTDGEEGPSEETREFMALLDTLEGMTTSDLTFQPADFEKDQDLNFHIDFIHAASQLRASNYCIKNCTRHKSKMIAGKIIPAIATTTASVTGLAMLEMLKIIQQKKLEDYKDSSNSLGLNLYLMQEPSPPEKAKDTYCHIEMAEVKCKPAGFTKWDATHIRGNMELTLGGFLALFKKTTGLNCDLLFHKIAEMGEENPTFNQVSGLMLYDRYATPGLKKIYDAKLDTMPLLSWIEERYNGLVDSGTTIELQTSCADDEGAPYKVPTVLYHV